MSIMGTVPLYFLVLYVEHVFFLFVFFNKNYNLKKRKNSEPNSKPKTTKGRQQNNLGGINTYK